MLCRCFTHTRMLRAIRRYADGSARMTPRSRPAQLLAPRTRSSRSRGALPRGVRRAGRRVQRSPSRRPVSVRHRASHGRSLAASSTRGSRSAPTARVTAYTGKCELGQGLYTAQMQLVAEELGVAARPRHADSVRHRARRPTRARRRARSRIPPNFNDAQPGARRRRPRAKRWSASRRERLGVPVDQLTAGDGVVRVARRSVEARDATASWSAAGRST